MKKILTVIGTRPQYIKEAVLSKILRTEFNEILVDTGQHYDYNLSGVFIDELDIPLPNYNLNVGPELPGIQLAKMIEGIEKIIYKEKPDGVLVFGDTNSTLAASIIAAKLHIPLIHVESGARSFNKTMPEEINRIMTDHLSNLLFATTQADVQNLNAEGITEGVFFVGDIMLDALKINFKKINNRLHLDNFNLKHKQYYLATIHRVENTEDIEKLEAIFNQLSKMDLEVILPLHPGTKNKLITYHLYDKYLKCKKIRIIDPISPTKMLFLEKNAKAIITDSGGVQKEAYFMKVPCFTVREQTEIGDTLKTRYNFLLNPFKHNFAEIINSPIEREYISNLFGEGNASKKIVGKISNFFY